MWVLAVAAARAQTVELPEDEVLASIRLRSLGGATAGIAESASAQLYNPAAMAMRRTLTDPARVDTDLALQIKNHPALATLGEALGFPSREAPYRRGWWQVGSDLRVGRSAVALHLRDQTWEGGETRYAGATIGAGVGYALPEVAVGVLPQLLVAQVGGERAVGAGVGAGVLLAPDGAPVRVGAGVRSPIRTGEIDGSPGPDPGGVDAPAAVRLPAELVVGGSLSIGARNQAGPFGPERVQDRPGAPLVLVAADLAFTAGSGDAVPLLAVLRDEPATPIGPTAALRAGAELWAVEHKARVRAGFGTVPGRGHQPAGWLVSAGVGYQLLDDFRGNRLRLAVGGELTETGPSVAVGFESW